MSYNPDQNSPATQQWSPPHGYPQPAGPRSNGVGIAALVVGIVAVVVGFIPLVGMVSFGLGPVAIILGIVGLILKNRRKGAAITGLVLGVVATVIAGIITAIVAAGVQAVDDSLNAEHTIEYVVTTDGDANVTYWDGDGMSSKDVSQDWSKTVTVTGMTLPSMTVTGDFMAGSSSVSCEIVVDGESLAKNTADGDAAMATCSADTFGSGE